MRRLVPLLLGLLALASGAAVAGATEETCPARQSGELGRLENVYSYRGIRVFWTDRAPSSGADHRLPSRSSADRNGNGIPDIVENIARQADAARRAFSSFGFPDPLDSPRYEGVRFIDVNILDMRHNGLAYDAPVRYPGAPGRGGDCTLRIDLSSRLETHLRGPEGRQAEAVFTQHWFVVGHEMFHLFQYGLTQFKRPWLNEPTAKWAEYSLRRREMYPDRTKDYRLPASMQELQAGVIGAPTSDTANLFWSRLIERVAAADSRAFPPELLKETYTDGEPIFKDDAWRGAGFVLAVYRALNKEERALSSSRGRNPLAWPERDQVSSAHDARLLAAIQQVVRDFGGGGPEVEAFLRIR